jgi:site-specific DNA recombinase
VPGKTFLIWRAVSSKEQAEKVSPELQEQMARDHVAKWGGTVLDVLDVAESRDIVLLSDAEATIPAYARLHDYIQRRAFDVLICYDLGRLGRAYPLATAIVELCRRASILIYELDNPPADLEPRGTYDEILIRGIKAMGYQHETMKTRERMRYGREGRAKGGSLPATPPYGYRWQYHAGGERTVEIDPEAAAVVRDIAARYLAGSGVAGIAMDLTARGIPTPSGGATWLKNSVARILERAWTYAGYAEFYRQRRTGYIRARGVWEPLWDEATAERIEAERAARAANRRISNTPSRLTGIVRCVDCGRSMWQVLNEGGQIRDRRGEHATVPRRAKFYCQPYHAGGSVSTRRVLAALAAALDDLAHADLSSIPDDDADRAAQLAAQLAAHDAAIARHAAALRRADDAYVGGVMDIDRYKAQVERLRAAIEAEQSARTAAEAAAAANAQRGSRADMLRRIAAQGPAMLITENTAAANVWLRQHVRAYVQGNAVVEVRFDYYT